MSWNPVADPGARAAALSDGAAAAAGCGGMDGDVVVDESVGADENGSAGVSELGIGEAV